MLFFGYRFLWIFLLMLLGSSIGLAHTPSEPKNMLTPSDAAVLGLVEGITEYLPVSSMGHMIIVNHILGLDAPTPLINQTTGTPLAHADKTPVLLSEATGAYSIAIQLGAILAVAVLYWKTILMILAGFMGKNSRGLQLGLNLIVAFIPAAILGLLLDHWIELHLFNPVTVAIALATGAGVIFIVESKLAKVNNSRSIESLSIHEAALIGLLQCFALCPGASRSLSTIIGGLVVGLSRSQAAAFSFLLGLVTLSAASFYKLISIGPVLIEAIPPHSFWTGFIVSSVTALISIKIFIKYLGNHSLCLFAYYRIALAVLILALLYL